MLYEYSTCSVQQEFTVQHEGYIVWKHCWQPGGRMIWLAGGNFMMQRCDWQNNEGGSGALLAATFIGPGVPRIGKSTRGRV